MNVIQQPSAYFSWRSLGMTDESIHIMLSLKISWYFGRISWYRYHDILSDIMIFWVDIMIFPANWWYRISWYRLKISWYPAINIMISDIMISIQNIMISTFIFDLHLQVDWLFQESSHWHYSELRTVFQYFFVFFAIKVCRS